MNKSEEILYRRVQKGKACRYEPVTEQPEPIPVVMLSDEQCITAAGTIGVMMLTSFEHIIPPHKLVARKIKAVERAILELYQGTGQPIDSEILNQLCSVWCRTMKIMSGEKIEQP